MNGYNDIHTEPSDDEEFALACGYEIISDEELFGILTLSYRDSFYAANRHHHREGLRYKFPFLSKKSTTSLNSPSQTSSGLSKPMSSCSLSSQGSDMSEEDFSCGSSSGAPDSVADPREDEDVHQLSVENLWYIIQQKRHNHHNEYEEEIRMAHHHFLTMEHHASNSKLTEWFSNILHFPEKLRQIVADKHRFNINKVPKEVRDELKHLYVY